MLLRAFVAAILLSQGTLLCAQISFEVRETAGIRRFDYPATARLTLPEKVSAQQPWRLMSGGKPLAAQIAADIDNPRQLIVDFKVSCAPLETQQFQIEATEVTAPSKTVSRTITARRVGTDWHVVGTNALTYRLPEDLKGFLQSVRHGEKEWLRGDSSGIVLVSRDGKSCSLGSPEFPVASSRVLREGTHCCELEFKAHGMSPDWQGIQCDARLTFPLAKSWFELSLNVRDPSDRLSAASLGLNFQVTPTPLLVDYAAGELTYLTLTNVQVSEFQWLPASENKPVFWEVLHGESNTLVSFARGERHSAQPGAWAHLMDKDLCTAVALAASAGSRRDAFRITGEGKLTVAREFVANSMEASPKQIRLWSHFVNFPPHISAVTSPQAMLAPLEVVPRAGR